MGLKLSGFVFEPHPEGWTKCCIKHAEAADGQFGPRIKWSLESQERKEDGEGFILTMYTGFVASKKSGLGKLVQACGFELPGEGEEFDSDELIGKVIECLVVVSETDKGQFNNIKEFRAKMAKNPPKKKKAEVEGDFRDPFADE